MSDPILAWNAVALEANRVSHTTGADRGVLGPPLSARALAIVHLAMYDAFAGVSGNPTGLPPYQVGLPAPGTGASVDAAVATAAHTTLAALFPSQKAFFDVVLAGGPGGGNDPGSVYGREVAQRLLALRAGDPDASDAGYSPSTAPGHHRPDPDNPTQGIHAPFYGARSKGFAITQRHPLGPPPALAHADYTSALQRVRRLGIAPALTGTLPASAVTRTPEETLVGIFWGYDGAAGLGTPPRLYNQIVRAVAQGRGNTPADNARLFALVNVAMADAGILAWDHKYRYDLWRPVVGIRQHSASSPVSADADPGWLPLGAPATNGAGKKNFTPNFPAYPSGHATFGAAALHITRRFCGIGLGNHAPDMLFDGLELLSEEYNGANADNAGAVRPRIPRRFPQGLWQMIEENGASRELLGVHWIFDAFALTLGGKPDLGQNVGGVPLGLKIAEDIYQSGMKLSTVGPR
jgi:vanadium chloroperoxidase